MTAILLTKLDITSLNSLNPDLCYECELQDSIQIYKTFSAKIISFIFATFAIFATFVVFAIFATFTIFSQFSQLSRYFRNFRNFRNLRSLRNRQIIQTTLYLSIIVCIAAEGVIARQIKIKTIEWKSFKWCIQSIKSMLD